jgi:hypothetical protein
MKSAKCQTHSIRRFSHRTRSIKWQNDQSVYLRVNYGKDINNQGKTVSFYNDGEYQTKAELIAALDAFIERE